MRRYLVKAIKLLAAAAAVASLLGAGPAFADSVNGKGQGQANGQGQGQGNTSNGSAASSATQAGTSLNLLGVVPVSCSIAIATTAKAASLDLKAGEQSVSVGVVTETCNSGNGYTVAITSQHGGQLRSGDASAPLASYSASYDDATGSIVSGLAASRNGAFFGRKANLVVSVPANAQAIAGNYSDSLTIVIAAK
mgnify:CR=1 FL=1